MNPWIQFLKEWAIKHNTNYSCALADPKAVKSYRAQKDKKKEEEKTQERKTKIRELRTRVQEKIKKRRKDEAKEQSLKEKEAEIYKKFEIIKKKSRIDEDKFQTLFNPNILIPYTYSEKASDLHKERIKLMEEYEKKILPQIENIEIDKNKKTKDGLTIYNLNKSKVDKLIMTIKATELDKLPKSLQNDLLTYYGLSYDLQNYNNKNVPTFFKQRYLKVQAKNDIGAKIEDDIKRAYEEQLLSNNKEEKQIFNVLKNANVEDIKKLVESKKYHIFNRIIAYLGKRTSKFSLYHGNWKTDYKKIINYALDYMADLINKNISIDKELRQVGFGRITARYNGE